ncbi:MAG: pantetheine-phosphate adenylyltransferase [Bacillota bacterium]|uniref:pantetheine-phosphate adenylyltransferase n=1 Tax=Desulfurispora thermophila TaxID=265470 RepID=UPI00036CA525|nr:pantetheine-phosphate adenylyltransferase [Desulfurispora thermophila]
MRIAVYPGSFDPITNGHLDVIERAAALFDEVIVAVSCNAHKRPLFTVEERVEILKAVLQPYYNVLVDSFYGLTVNFAREKGAQAIVRGLRAISDFENEFMMALTNKKLAPGIETIFLMTRAEFSFISSTAVKEVMLFGGCVRDMVPPLVEERLKDKYRQLRNAGEVKS